MADAKARSKAWWSSTMDRMASTSHRRPSVAHAASHDSSRAESSHSKPIGSGGDEGAVGGRGRDTGGDEDTRGDGVNAQMAPFEHDRGA